MPLTVREQPTEPKPGEYDAGDRPYRPYGACLEVFGFRGAEGLISGGAGTGKSIAVLTKIYMACEKYPNIRVLICRKTRESMTQSVLVTWEDKVVPEGSAILRGPARNERKEYVFPNGSKVIVAGLRQSSRDNTQQVMSTEYDLIYVQESIELTEDEWEKLTTRLRNYKMPYQQIIGDTNPSAPSHWLKKRCDRNQCKIFYSDHTDNPVYWDHDANDWTTLGRTYINKLDALTGARKERLRYGRWVQAEGVVYENWNPATHIVDLGDKSYFPNGVIPADWRRIISIDFGFTAAFVAQWWALDPDGRMILYREYVRTHTLVETHAKNLMDLTRPNESISAYVCDHDAEGRATLEKYLLRSTVMARKDISTGLQATESRMNIAGDGKPRLLILRDSLISRDDRMEDEKAPIGFVEEIEGYVWDRTNLKNPKEKPIYNNDHSMDCARYAVMHFEVGTVLDIPESIKNRNRERPVEFEADRPSVTDWRKKGMENWRGRGSVNWRDQV